MLPASAIAAVSVSPSICCRMNASLNIALLTGQAARVQVLREMLLSAGFNCRIFDAGRELIRDVGRASYDLLLIDRTHTDMPSIDIVRMVRWAWDMPIMVLADAGGEDELVEALEAGADDYITKPVNFRELQARILALSRRVACGRFRKGLVIEAGPYEIDCVTRHAILRGKRIPLTPKEFRLTVLLFSNAGRAVSIADIESAVWGHELQPLSRALAGLVSRMRRTLALGTANGVLVSVIYSHGYRLDVLGEHRKPGALPTPSPKRIWPSAVSGDLAVAGISNPD